MPVRLFDGSLFVPRVLVKRLQFIAEEITAYGGETVDEHDVARQILEEFVRVRLGEASRMIAQRMQRTQDEYEQGQRRIHDVNLDILPPGRTFLFHDAQTGVRERVGINRRNDPYAPRPRPRPHFPRQMPQPQYDAEYEEFDEYE